MLNRNIDNITITEAREMSEKRLTLELGKRSKKLEELGMGHEDACYFVSSVMNIGIVFQERKKKTLSFLSAS